MYINYFILQAGYAGFCWYAALWFYPLKLADVKKALHNHTMKQTNCMEIGRRRTIWGLGKALNLCTVELPKNVLAQILHQCLNVTPRCLLKTAVANFSEDVPQINLWPWMCCCEHGHHWTSAERLKVLEQKAAKTTHEEQTVAALPLDLNGVSWRI